MPPLTAIGAFATLSFALIITPGPSIMFVVGQALRLGRRAALLTVAANAAGFYVHVVVVAVGAGALVERSPGRLAVLQLVGATYLIWLGIGSLRRSTRFSGPAPDSDAVSSDRLALRDGFIVGLTNPKSLVFFVAVLPRHINTDGIRPDLQMATLGVIFVVLAVISDGAWALAAGSARDWFAGDTKRLRNLSLVGGLVMVGLGMQMGLSTRF